MELPPLTHEQSKALFGAWTLLNRVGAKLRKAGFVTLCNDALEVRDKVDKRQKQDGLRLEQVQERKEVLGCKGCHGESWTNECPLEGIDPDDGKCVSWH